MLRERTRLNSGSTKQVSTWLTNAQAFFPDIITGIVAHWKMNDNSANTDVVESVGSNNGTAQQNTNILTTAKVDRALSFNGTSDVINCGDIPAIDTSPFSVSLWIKPTNVANYQGLVNKRDSAGWIFAIDSSGYLSVFNGYGFISGTTLLTSG